MLEGETGLILRIPEAEPVVGKWRSGHDSSAPLGVPAHVTVLYPWIPMDQLTDADRAAAAEIVARMSPFDLTFAAVGRFPAALWLDPRPGEPILALTRAFAGRWPAYPPYGGEHGDDLVPHLTISDSTDPDELGHIVADVEAALPLHSRVDELSLLVHQGGCWSLEQVFPFRSSAERDVRDVAGPAHQDRGECVDLGQDRAVAGTNLGLHLAK